VSSANPRALRLYERLGFVRGREKGKYAASRDDLLTRLGV
jgi:ribosomal protein S18 acetylase RimI-like enzyme